ncbi:MAG: GNAT family N-acetyltransferase [Clostridia bacterium]|nr:GNAT family N-acetyltransferase [Clostridia bacterium]
MTIRKADKKDIQSIMKLLRQVLDVHAGIRPDIFKQNTTKYTDEELYYIITNPLTPVFVAEDEGEILGHCFCKFIRFSKDNVLTDVKTLYIDDICVDENSRGRGVGRALYDYAEAFASSEKCYNITLNVWNGNDSAIKFYESLGLGVQKITMEKIL